MAKYDITYSCGHSDTVQLYGPGKDRESKIAWYQRSGSCPACYRAKKDAERLAANQAAAEANQLAALPALTGSEKQIAWAESIRKPVAEALRKIDAAGANSKLSAAAQQEVTDAMALVVDEVLQQTEAKWWIDHRGTDTIPTGSADIVARMKQRGLTPLADAEMVAIRAEATAQREAEARRMGEAMAAAVTETGKDHFGHPIYTLTAGSVEIDQHGVLGQIKLDSGITLDVVFGGAFKVSGKLVEVLPEHASAARHLLDAARAAQRDLYNRCAAEAQAAFEATLPGVSVVSVETNKKRSEPNLIATLSDGRQAAGYYSKKDGATIASIWTDYGAGWGGKQHGKLAIDHPEAIRLANEAKAKL